jgi:hypothetical protein
MHTEGRIVDPLDIRCYSCKFCTNKHNTPAIISLRCRTITVCDTGGGGGAHGGGRIAEGRRDLAAAAALPPIPSPAAAAGRGAAAAIAAGGRPLVTGPLCTRPLCAQWPSNYCAVRTVAQ